MGRLLLLLSLAPRTVGGFQPMHVREAPRAAVVARGIPKMFRWLTDQYPAIMERMADGLPAQQKKSDVDDLYLDMNGIIHTCSHPNDEDVSDKLSLKDMITGMFFYIDHMVQTVRPQKLLYMAIDGCAPRAKMNQQRSRRYRSAKDLAENKAEAIAKGEVSTNEELFDSNCITPGPSSCTRSRRTSTTSSARS